MRRHSAARSVLAAALAATAAACATTPSDDTVGVPARFQGEWNRNLADCGTARNDSTLRLGADRIAFHESAGQIASAIVTDQTDLAITARMQGEGEAWTATYRFRLSDARTTLTDVTTPEGMVRYRCP
jgi:hypothetical protein